METLDDLQTEIERLLAASARSEIDHAEATRLTAEAHQAEVEDLVEVSRRLADVHSCQEHRREQAHAKTVQQLEQALASRDVIGQAKGVLIVAMRCTGEHAFAVMVRQSQYENRKLVEIAAEIVERAQRRAVPRSSELA